MLKNLLRLCVIALVIGVGQTAHAQVQNYQRWSIPESANPNQETLEFYLKRYLNDFNKFSQYAAPPSTNPVVFDRALRDESQVKQALNNTALLSYILYEHGKIAVDQINPRFAHLVNDQTKFYSMSMGKSITAYVLGHAVCSNMIPNLDHKISDWPVVQGTLYQNAALIDLVNMRAGDQHVVNERQGFIRTGRNPNNLSMQTLADHELKGTTAAEPYFNYNSVSPNLVLNYVIYRSNGKFDELMTEIFQKKIRTEHSVFFLKQVRGQEGQGLARATFYATRYDYLRIARAMLDDWQNNTCEGRFLKEVYSRQQAKQGDQMQYSNPSGPFWAHRGYGGFFHTNFYDVKKDRNIISMQGYGGQMIVIDFDQGRIVATHAVHNNFDWKSLVSDVIRSGKFKKYFWN
jgi:CubicO group peptidase (beta-lactamase class C family)